MSCFNVIAFLRFVRQVCLCRVDRGGGGGGERCVDRGVRAVGRRPKLALQFVESLPRAGMHGKHGHYTHPAQTPHPTVPYLLLHLSSLQPLLRLLEAHITQLELLLPLARSSLCVGKGGRRIDGRENSWEKGESGIVGDGLVGTCCSSKPAARWRKEASAASRCLFRRSGVQTSEYLSSFERTQE